MIKILLLIPLVMLAIILGLSYYPHPGGWVEVFTCFNDNKTIANYDCFHIDGKPLTASHYLAGSNGYVLFHPGNTYSMKRLHYFHH